jgi:hypothetical protein
MTIYQGDVLGIRPVRLVLPCARVVGGDEHTIRVVLPGACETPINLPRYTAEGEDAVQVRTYVPVPRPGQTYRALDTGALLHGVYLRGAEAPELFMDPETGEFIKPEAAVDEYGPLELVADRQPGPEPADDPVPVSPAAAGGVDQSPAAVPVSGAPAGPEPAAVPPVDEPAPAGRATVPADADLPVAMSLVMPVLPDLDPTPPDPDPAPAPVAVFDAPPVYRRPAGDLEATSNLTDSAARAMAGPRPPAQRGLVPAYVTQGQPS